MTCCGCADNEIDLKIIQGVTFRPVFRWGNRDTVLYKNVTGASKSAPLRLTVVGHGIPDQWPVVVRNLGGMRQANFAESIIDAPEAALPATVIDTDTIDINGISSQGFSTYTSGGAVEFFEPVDLSTAVITMKIFESFRETTALLTITSADDIDVDNTAKTIIPVIDEVDTAALTWTKAVYTLYATIAGTVTEIAHGTITVEQR